MVEARGQNSYGVYYFANFVCNGHGSPSPKCLNTQKRCAPSWKPDVTTDPCIHDLTLLNPSTAKTQCILERLIVLIDWAGMKFKPKKSRSLVLSKGKVDEDFHFYLHEQPIPSVSEEPIKSLGRWYTKDLRDISHV